MTVEISGTLEVYARGDASGDAPGDASGDALGGGYADPPRDAARAFRAILDAMARPGVVTRTTGAAPPAPFGAAMGAAALTLADPDAPVWLAEDWAGAELRGWIGFHCGAPILADPGAAMFAFGPAGALAPADRFALGTPENPHLSATLICGVSGFEGPGLRLSGPGVDGAAHLPLSDGDRAAVLALLAPQRGLFPLGRDLILCADDRIAAIPRSTRVEEG
ncbi:MAG: phosphonate C-P lyase system protein PhnH [Pseudomonadota bacterium]